MNHEIAVRFYENRKYGHTYAKGAFHKAVFNATADLAQPKAKYLLDLFTYREWQHAARTDAQMQAVDLVSELLGQEPSSDILVSYIQRMDHSGAKQPVLGFAVLDLSTHLLQLLISDTALGVEETWQLQVKPCRAAARNQNSPQLLATNMQLA